MFKKIYNSELYKYAIKDMKNKLVETDYFTSDDLEKYRSEIVYYMNQNFKKTGIKYYIARYNNPAILEHGLILYHFQQKKDLDVGIVNKELVY